MSISGRARVWLSIGLSAFLVVILPIFYSFGTAYATGQLTSRSLTLQAGTDPGSKPSGHVNNLFGFTIATTNNIGSIQFQYCTNATSTCVTPTGLHTTSTTLGTMGGATFTSLVTTTDGAPYVSRTAASISATTAVTIQLLNVTNPSTVGSFFVKISTFASTDTTGTAIDSGFVTASTAQQIVLTGVMPESIIFCAGATVGTTGGIPDCTIVGSGSINFNQLFSTTATATATSQMAASTNAASGYVITETGPTLTSGSNTILAMSSADISRVGHAQFGMNLRANTTASSTPAVGTDVTPAANGTNYKGQALTGYSTIDNFKFVTAGDSVANSQNGGAGPSDSQIFTSTYIVNVTGSQTAGTYVSTLTYICTATF